jgi:hypothetical protein
MFFLVVVIYLFVVDVRAEEKTLMVNEGLMAPLRWSNASIWSGLTLPGPNDDVVVIFACPKEGADNVFLIADVNATVRSFQLRPFRLDGFVALCPADQTAMRSSMIVNVGVTITALKNMTFEMSRVALDNGNLNAPMLRFFSSSFLGGSGVIFGNASFSGSIEQDCDVCFLIPKGLSLIFPGIVRGTTGAFNPFNPSPRLFETVFHVVSFFLSRGPLRRFGC